MRISLEFIWGFFKVTLWICKLKFFQFYLPRVCNSAFSNGSDSASNSEKLILSGLVAVRFWFSESVLFDEVSLIVVVARTVWVGFAGSEKRK